MSIYNMVFGMNAQLSLVVSCVLGFRVDKTIPRFRNTFLKADDCPFAEYDFLIYRTTSVVEFNTGKGRAGNIT